MPPLTRPVLAVFLVCGAAFAANWSGILVDSNCYASKERNVSPTDSLLYVDRDRGAAIQYCSPEKKTKSFGVVQPDGSELDLDPAGNAKAAALVRTAGKKSHYTVIVTGNRIRNTLAVDSISLSGSASRKVSNLK